jgi:hypothetical protein
LIGTPLAGVGDCAFLVSSEIFLLVDRQKREDNI